MKGIQERKETLLNRLNKEDNISLEPNRCKIRQVFKIIGHSKSENWIRACININSQVGFIKL